MIVWIFLLGPGLSQGLAGATKRYSTLSDGSFETQMPRPEYDSLVPGSKDMASALRAYETLPFDVGERLRFKVTYLGIKGGTAEIAIHHPVKRGQGWRQRVTGEVLSARWYAWIIELHDAVEAVFSLDNDFTPDEFFINQMEGKFRQSKIVRFFPEKREIHQTTKRKGREEKNESFPHEQNAKDALGAFYYLRQQVNARGGGNLKFSFEIFTSEKTWVGNVSWLRSEVKEVEGVKYDADVYALDTQFGGLLQQEGDIRMWLTRDSRRLPVYVQANVAFGYIEVHLVEWDQGFANAEKKKIYPPLRATAD
jgi:hypothetical protein